VGIKIVMSSLKKITGIVDFIYFTCKRNNGIMDGGMMGN
jgi:hypothetical protein